MLSQPKMESLDNPVAYCVGLALLGVGTVFVLSSFFALGFTGTFLGKTPKAVDLEQTHSGFRGGVGARWPTALPSVVSCGAGFPALGLGLSMLSSGSWLAAWLPGQADLGLLHLGHKRVLVQVWGR